MLIHTSRIILWNNSQFNYIHTHVRVTFYITCRYIHIRRMISTYIDFIWTYISRNRLCTIPLVTYFDEKSGNKGGLCKNPHIRPLLLCRSYLAPSSLLTQLFCKNFCIPFRGLAQKLRQLKREGWIPDTFIVLGGTNACYFKTVL